MTSEKKKYGHKFTHLTAHRGIQMHRCTMCTYIETAVSHLKSVPSNKPHCGKARLSGLAR